MSYNSANKDKGYLALLQVGGLNFDQYQKTFFERCLSEENKLGLPEDAREKMSSCII